jgi:multiple sugar transport system permease protein
MCIGTSHPTFSYTYITLKRNDMTKFIDSNKPRWKFWLTLSNEQKFGYLLVAPLLIWLTLVLFYPFLYVIFLSFFKQAPGSEALQFKGLLYFNNLLFRDDAFIRAFFRSLHWTFFNVLAQFLAGIMVALLLRRQFKGASIVRLWTIVPWITPVVVAALVWRWMLSPTIGVIEEVLRQASIIENYLNLLGNIKIVMYTVIGIHSWRFFPFVVVIILGRIMGIPEELYEAAKVDGASNFQRFLYVTLPQLRGVLLTFLMLATVWTFTSFDTIFLMTGGGPVEATTTLPILVYRKAFKTYQLNEAAALSLIMFFITSIFMAIYIKFGAERND